MAQLIIDEEPWVNDPLALLANPFSISPFQRGLTPAARLNAHARLTFLIGLGFFLVMRKESKTGLIGLLYIVLWTVGQGVQFVQSEEGKEELERKKIMKQLKKQSTNRMADDPSRVIQSPPPADQQAQVGGATPLPVAASSVDPSVVVPKTTAQLIQEQQRQFQQINHELTRMPTRFDVQNQALKIGGVSRQHTSRFLPQSDLGRIHPNPGPFDFGTAITSTNPQAYTYETNVLERMMRPVDEVDPGLVTNPIPDPTFMARPPQFDHSEEYEAEQRWRLQQGSRMRFW